LFQALYRQLRPRTFDEIMEQDAIVQTLKNQIISGRISHAYLFCGTRGTGKTSTAKVFARALTCLEPIGAEACEKCSACLASRDDATVDIIEMDAASNRGINDIRSLRDGVSYPPQMGKRKIYIIDEVHALSQDAFNALLKTLEEPPVHVVFILATTEPQKLPATILSRCQRFDFRRIPVGGIARHLKLACETAKATYEEDALLFLARAAEGSIRDGLSLLDLCISTGRGNVTVEVIKTCLGASGREFMFEFAGACAQSDVARCIVLIDELLLSGREIAVFVRELSDHMRNLMVAATCGDNTADILDISTQDAQRLRAQAEEMGQERALRAMELLSEMEGDLRLSSQSRVLLELAVVKICMPQTQTSFEALLERISRLEKAVKEGAFAPAAEPAKTSARKQAERALDEKTQDSKMAQGPQKGAAQKPDAALGNIWKEVLAMLKKDKIRLFVSLNRAGLAGFRGDVAVINFPRDQAIHMVPCQKDENKSAIEAAFSQVTGRTVYVDFTSGDSLAAAKGAQVSAPAGADRAAKAAKDSDESKTLEAAVISAFGADIVEIVDE
jgi:DNA polymerase-3 subunit gamma/tau